MMQGSARNEKPQPWGRGFFFRLGCASRSVGFRPSSEPHRKFSPVASSSPLEWRALSAPFKDQFLHAPIRRNLVVIMDTTIIVAVPGPIGAFIVLRRLVELVFCEIRPIAAEVRIVLQRGPWHWVCLLYTSPSPRDRTRS